MGAKGPVSTERGVVDCRQDSWVFSMVGPDIHQPC